MIDKLITSINKHGIARTNRYDINIRPPSGITASTDELNIACEALTLPGRGYSTDERRTYGPLIKIPYDKLYNEITMTFRCGESLEERVFFSSWLDLISNPRTHEFSFYENYVGTIEIKQLNTVGDNDVKYTQVLREAYPTTMGAVELSQEGANEYHKLQVTFAYKEWTTD